MGISAGLDPIIKIRSVSYNWKDESRGKGTQYGVIAQELETVLPSLVSEFEAEGANYKGVSYTGLIAPLIEAVKELKAEIDSLKAEIASLKK